MNRLCFLACFWAVATSASTGGPPSSATVDAQERVPPAMVLCEEPSRLFMGAEAPRFRVAGDGPVSGRDAPTARPQGDGRFVETSLPVLAGEVSATRQTWRVEDWRGTVVRRGVCAADDLVEVAGLPPGYWTLRVEGAEPVTFTTVVDPLSRRRVAESPFAADSAFSWMDISTAFAPSFKADYSAHLARLLRAAGITQTRERFAWNGAQKEIGGPISWGKYLKNAKLLAENDIKISWMNAGTPKFAGGAGGGWGVASLATNLVAVRDFCEEVGRVFGPYLADFEYLNEPDLLFPAWDAAAQFKAASVGFRAAGSGVPVANFAMCMGVDFAYDNLVFDNGLANYIDVFNIHDYSKLSAYDAFDARVHRFLEKRGIGGMPILITESGCEEEGEASLPTDTPRCKAQSSEQELFVADFLAKAQIKRQFGGVWRNHFFIFASFHERGGRKDWGLVRRDGSARPGVAAFATLTAELDGARMLGRADVGQGIEAYLYDNGDGTRTLAFWEVESRKSKVESPRVAQSGILHSAFSILHSDLRLVDWCGTPQPIPADGTIRAESRVSYLTGAFDVPISQSAVPVGTLQRSRSCATLADLSTVIRVNFPKDEFDVVDGFTAVETKRGGEGRVKVEIWNLDDRPKRGRLFSEGGALDGWPEGDIDLAPRGVYTHEATLRPLCGKEGEAVWRLHGVFDGRETTPFVAIVRDFASALAGMRRSTVDVADTANWRRNTSAPKVTFTPEGDAMRIDHSWVGAAPTPDGRWAYNGIRVPEEARRSLKYVVFEIRSEQDKVENNYSTANVFAARRGGAADRIPCGAPAKEWTKIHVGIPSGNGAEVEWIGVGGNPAGKQVTMWVRNVEFFCTEQ